MKKELTTTCFVLSTLFTPLICGAADLDIDHSDSKAFVKDSVITTKIKAQLAKEKIESLTYISVDTDNIGVVWLGGSAKNQNDIDRAVSIARDTKGVISVENHIHLKIE